MEYVDLKMTDKIGFKADLENLLNEAAIHAAKEQGIYNTG